MSDLGSSDAALGGRPTILGAPMLSPVTLLRPAGKIPPPLDGDGVQWHYRGRNAVWYGIGALPLHPGEAILFPAYHCGSELDPILRRGITVRYYRVDRRMRIDLEDLIRQADAAVRAVFLIHYLGIPQDVDEVLNLCRRRGLFLVEDCAHALYGSHRGRPLGSLGDVAIFSLRKTLPLPDGGALLTNTLPALPLPKADGPPAFLTLRAAKHLAEQHMRLGTGATGDWITRLALNLIPGLTRGIRRRFFPRWYGAALPDEKVADETQFPMDQAGWEFSGLSRWLFLRIDHAATIARRRENFRWLAEALRGLPGLSLVFPDLPDGAVPWQFPILVNDPGSLRTHLAAARIESGLLWEFPHAASPSATEQPEAAYLRKHVLCLPMHQDVQPDDLERMACAIREWKGAA